MKKIVAFLLSLSSLYLYTANLEPLEIIDIITNFSLDELCPTSKIIAETRSNVRCFFDFNTYITSCYSPDVKRIFFMNDVVSLSNLVILPDDIKKKLILFTWEPGGVNQAYADFFSRVYTFNGTLVDQIKYFNFFYPVLTPLCSDLAKFEDKKLCVMISQSPSPERIKIITFFENKPEEDFEFYGHSQIIQSTRYRGSIPGHPLSQEKFSMLKKYRFCVCFENSSINGYITEKIFAGFAAGCVPIYWGAPNIKEYIPQECFIDYRNFQNDEELYNFIKNMSEQTHQHYINNIRTFLLSEKAYLFSAEHFSEIIHDAIMH